MISVAESKPDLAKYEVHEEIGAGGMATVYRATDRRLGREVAVKIIHRHLRESREVAARFASEARAVAKLKHPNIVEVYDVSDEAEDERYLVVELVRGTTLRKLLGKFGHLPPEVAAALGLELASALEHAHEAGVIHRDVKPENVLVELDSDRPSGRGNDHGSKERGPRIMLTDFGIAKLLDAQGVTSTGQVLGSPAHMAPEQIEGGDVSVRSDVFALAVLLYECMVGHLPFHGKNPAQVLRRVLDGLYSPADTERQTVGAQWARILARGLANAPGDRYASVAELEKAMRAELDELGFTDPKQELASYLLDPEAYREGHEPRVVERLVARGEEARERRDVPLAAALFNRALAYRPSDSALVLRVTRLARGQRVRANASRIATIAGVSLALGGLAYGATRAVTRSDDDPMTNPATSVTPERVGSPGDLRGAGHPARPGDPEGQGARDRRAPSRLAVRPLGSAPRPTGEMRLVTITSIEPANATVQVDGKPVPQWDGYRSELAVGTSHRLDLTPPDGETCCDRSSQTFTVVAGDGPQQITGRLKFRPAGLAIPPGPAGAYATCVPLFYERLLPGTSHQTAMKRASEIGTCTLTVGTRTKNKGVTLEAGKTLSLSWQ